ncbi:hypothetical protein HY604_05220 [Candidatus Peregrinibacteria bacterium]|nr:hypothetical protein [Candidatus Peregrinibacteria bacterium]
MQKVFVVLVIFFSFLSAVVYAESPVLSDAQILKTIQNAVEWFRNAQEDSGHFRYEYMPFWDRYVDDDNMVRQAGGFYVLGEVAVKMAEDFDLQGNMKKAIGYFETNSLDSVFGGYDFQCLQKTANNCTLGGTSLLLVGLLDFVEAYPDFKNKYANLIEDYKNFVMAMKMSGAGFMEKYDLEKGKNQNFRESEFSNGEALLALARYYLYDPSDEVKMVIEDSLNYFIAKYRKQWDGNFYLWGMAALKSWYPLFPEEKYYIFVKDYTDWRIETQQKFKKSARNRCAYVEGVVSAYSVLEADMPSMEKRAKYLEEIDFWLTKSRVLQLKKTDTVKLIFGENSKILVVKKPLRAIGGFMTDWWEPFQRIDFTQHCLSAYLQKLKD